MKGTSTAAVLTTVGTLVAMSVAGGPAAPADTVAYVVNVTVRPGYHFANADEALRYGRGICDKVAARDAFARIIDDLKADFEPPTTIRRPT